MAAGEGEPRGGGGRCETLAHVEQEGVEAMIDALRVAVRAGTYRPSRCGGDTSRRPKEGSGHSGFRRCGTGSRRWRRRSYWSRFLRRISGVHHMAFGGSAAPRRHWRRCGPRGARRQPRARRGYPRLLRQHRPHKLLTLVAGRDLGSANAQTDAAVACGGRDGRGRVGGDNRRHAARRRHFAAALQHLSACARSGMGGSVRATRNTGPLCG